jgi:hypothetical protein
MINLNNQPTIDELAQLFAARKDTLDDHVLWICEEGRVHIDPVAPCSPAGDSGSVHPKMRARLRTYRRGHGYVGKKAAADREFMGRVLHTLKSEWHQTQSQKDVRFVDRFC